MSAGVPILVIDPLHYPSLKSPEQMPGRRLARYIEKVTKGIFLELPAIVLDTDNRIIKVINFIAGSGERSRFSESLGGEIEKYSSTNGLF